PGGRRVGGFAHLATAGGNGGGAVPDGAFRGNGRVAPRGNRAGVGRRHRSPGGAGGAEARRFPRGIVAEGSRSGGGGGRPREPGGRRTAAVVAGRLAWAVARLGRLASGPRPD